MQTRDIRQTSWFWLDNSILDMGLSSNELAVYCLLCRMAKDNVCYPSTRFMAKKLKIGLTTIKSVINKLKELKLIEVQSGNKESSNIYTILGVPVADLGRPQDQGDTVADPGVIPQATTNNTNITKLNNNTTDTPKKPSKNQKMANPDLVAVRNYFCQGWGSKFGRKYMYEKAKDTELLKAMLEIYPVDDLKNLIDKYFKSQDTFINSTGFTIGVLYKTANKVMTEKAALPRVY